VVIGILTNHLQEQYGINATVLLMQLISEYNYYKGKETLTEDGYFYSTVEHLENETCLSGHEQRKAINILAELDILMVVSKGIPAKRHFKINFESISKLFDKLEKARRNAENLQPLKILTTSREKAEPQERKKINTNNKIYNKEIQGLKDYVSNVNLATGEQEELEKEFERLGINLTEEYIQILSQTAYVRLLFMRAGVVSVFDSPHRYKLKYLSAKKLIAQFDRYAEFAEKSEIDEPIRYFKKMLIEYLNEQIAV